MRVSNLDVDMNIRRLLQLARVSVLRGVDARRQGLYLAGPALEQLTLRQRLLETLNHPRIGGVVLRRQPVATEIGVHRDAGRRTCGRLGVDVYLLLRRLPRLCDGDGDAEPLLLLTIEDAVNQFIEHRVAQLGDRRSWRLLIHLQRRLYPRLQL